RVASARGPPGARPAPRCGRRSQAVRTSAFLCRLLACLTVEALPRPRPKTGAAAQLHRDDHHAALAALFVAVLVFFIRLGRRLPALVPHRYLELRPLVAPALFLLAASDLFDDPRLEHRREPLPKCVQYPRPGVKFGSFRRKHETQ